MKRVSEGIWSGLRRYATGEAGVATVDWVVLFGAATGAAVMALNISSNNLGGYSRDVRGELQNPHFDTEWTTALEIPPQEVWGNEGTILPSYDPEDPDRGTLAGYFDPTLPPPEEPEAPADGDGTEPDDGSDDGTDPDDGANGGSNPGGGGGLNIPTAPVVGCPTIDYAGPVSTRTGSELAGADLDVFVTAGGDTHLGTCSGGAGWGYFNANPSATLFLSGMDGMTELEIETRDSCDTVLLVRDAQGNFYFDDDGNSGYSRYASRLKFRSDWGFDLSRFNGRVDIWVGTYWGNSCDNVRVEIDTID